MPFPPCCEILNTIHCLSVQCWILYIIAEHRSNVYIFYTRHKENGEKRQKSMDKAARVAGRVHKVFCIQTQMGCVQTMQQGQWPSPDWITIPTLPQPSARCRHHDANDSNLPGHGCRLPSSSYWHSSGSLQQNWGITWPSPCRLLYTPPAWRYYNTPPLKKAIPQLQGPLFSQKPRSERTPTDSEYDVGWFKITQNFWDIYTNVGFHIVK